MSLGALGAILNSKSRVPLRFPKARRTVAGCVCGALTEPDAGAKTPRKRDLRRIHQPTEAGWHTAAQYHRLQFDEYATVPLLEPRDAEQAPDETTTGPRGQLAFRRLAVAYNLLNAGGPHEAIPGCLIPTNIVGL